MKVSVIMPWAGEPKDTLAYAIQSINQQTSKPFEKLLITARKDLVVSQELSPLLVNWKVISPNKNCLPGEARNFGLRNLNNESTHILLLDADDISHPERIARLSSSFTDGNCKVVGSQAVLFTQSTKRSDIKFFGYPKVKLGEEKIKSELLKNRIPMVMASIMFDRRIVDSQIAYPEDLKRGEDLEFLKLVISSGFPIMNIDKVLYAYRRKPLQSFEDYRLDVKFRGVKNFLIFRYTIHLAKRIFFLAWRVNTTFQWKKIAMEIEDNIKISTTL
jgi:glycosyltransferase involved in cell wall biosynthesis